MRKAASRVLHCITWNLLVSFPMLALVVAILLTSAKSGVTTSQCQLMNSATKGWSANKNDQLLAWKRHYASYWQNFPVTSKSNCYVSVIVNVTTAFHVFKSCVSVNILVKIRLRTMLNTPIKRFHSALAPSHLRLWMSQPWERNFFNLAAGTRKRGFYDADGNLFCAELFLSYTSSS